MSGLFAGAVYDPEEDEERLSGQILRIYDLMIDGHWRTLAEIEEITNDPPASISAQLRHLRKPRFGSYIVEKRPRGLRSNGLYEYRVLPAAPSVLPSRTLAMGKRKRNPFMAGVMYAAKLILEQPDIASAKGALKNELMRLKEKE